MKNLATIILFTILSAGIVISDKTGPTSDYSGAPMANGNPGRTCATLTGCHTNNANLNAGISIKLSLKGDTQSITEFENGKTYTVTVSVTGSSVARGFQATILDAAHIKAGTVANPSNGAKKVSIGPRDFVEHNTPSSLGVWSFDWTTPASGSPDTAIIYAAGNAANNNSASTGDDIETTSLILTLNNTAGKSEPTENPAIVAFPNPVKDMLFLNKKVTLAELYKVNGTLVHRYSHCQSVDFSELPCGYYYLRILTGSESQTIVVTK